MQQRMQTAQTKTANQIAPFSLLFTNRDAPSQSSLCKILRHKNSRKGTDWWPATSRGIESLDAGESSVLVTEMLYSCYLPCSNTTGNGISCAGFFDMNGSTFESLNVWFLNSILEHKYEVFVQCTEENWKMLKCIRNKRMLFKFDQACYARSVTFHKVCRPSGNVAEEKKCF